MLDHLPTNPRSGKNLHNDSVENQNPQSHARIDPKMVNDGESMPAGEGRKSAATLWNKAKTATVTQEVSVNHVKGNKFFETARTATDIVKMEHDAKLQALKKKDHVANGLLGDLDVLKAAAHEQLYEEEYDVTSLYFKEGIAQWIARSEVFSRITLGVISINAVWMGVVADRSESDGGESYVQVVENSFAVFFVSELLIRFLAFAKKQDSTKDAWFRFDLVLVSLMILETWIFPAVSAIGELPVDTALFRIVRLARLSRLMRLFSKFPELITLLKGLGAAVRSVSSTLGLLFLCMYVFAIIFRQQVDGNEVLEGYFGTMGDCFWTLLLHGTLLDNVGIVLKDLRENSPALAGVMLLFILLANLTILNMLIGVLCEVVCAIGDFEKDKALVRYTKTALMGALVEHDHNHHGQLSQPEFEDFVRHPKVKDVLDNLGVNQDNLLRSAAVIFSADEKPEEDEEEHCLPYGVILEHILTLRSSNTALVGDIMDLQHFIKMNSDKTNEYLMQVSDCLEKLNAKGTDQQNPLTSCLSPPSSPLSPRTPRTPRTPTIPNRDKAGSSPMLPQVEEKPFLKSLSVSSLPRAIHAARADPQIQCPQRVEKGFKMPTEPNFRQAATTAELHAKIDGIIQNMQIEVQQLTVAALDQKINDIIQDMPIKVQELILHGERVIPGSGTRSPRCSSPAAGRMPNTQIHGFKDDIATAAPVAAALDRDDRIRQKQNPDIPKSTPAGLDVEDKGMFVIVI